MKPIQSRLWEISQYSVHTSTHTTVNSSHWEWKNRQNREKKLIDLLEGTDRKKWLAVEGWSGACCRFWTFLHTPPLQTLPDTLDNLKDSWATHHKHKQRQQPRSHRRLLLVHHARGLLDVSALRYALAVFLIRHLHPLHRRHDEDDDLSTVRVKEELRTNR